MKVWLVIETADYTTEAVFATEEAAWAYVDEKQRAHVEAMRRAVPNYEERQMWGIVEEEVRE